ncbi:hypothetical protein HED22_11325 [Thalassospira sp. HF15]|uniref:hypothetical protein n=1 Tax=Thalassospira sp. HF15 TaxID=2722755 RepID=UPI001431AA6C|nr:hypothetical protein [Thalassospira sp. HF15]NIY76233.1 hypothetical protein [Thalassospira sp. HF15]
MLLSQLVCRAAQLLSPATILFIVLAFPGRAEEQGLKDLSAVEEVSVGNVAVVTPRWLSTLDNAQRTFYDALITAPNIIWNDGVPFDRLMALYHNSEFDCIVGESLRPIAGSVHSNYDIRFEMVIYGRRGEDLFNRNVVSVGYLATLPKFNLPFEIPVEWYGLRTIDQGADLVKIGRIDLLIAHAGLFADDPELQTVPLPPVHVVDLTLQCHDTPLNRDFLFALDQRIHQLRNDNNDPDMLTPKPYIH